jgi:hypothetical protein
MLGKKKISKKNIIQFQKLFLETIIFIKQLFFIAYSILKKNIIFFFSINKISF